MRIYPEGTTQFLKDRASDIRTPASREDYRKVLRHFQNFIPTKSIHHVKIQDCINYLNQPNQRTGKPLAPNTVLARKTTLTAFFGWANWKGLTTATPMAGIENVVKPKAKNVTQGRWLGDTERKMLLAGCPDDFVGQRDRVLLMLGMFCGLRREDLAKVRWGDTRASAPKGWPVLSCVPASVSAWTLPLMTSGGPSLASWRTRACPSRRSALPCGTPTSGPRRGT
jgi:site-specific recombinase XerD